MARKSIFYSGDLSEEDKKNYFIWYGRDGYRWRRTLRRWNHYYIYFFIPFPITLYASFPGHFISVPSYFVAIHYGILMFSWIFSQILHFKEGRAVEKELYRRKGIKVKIWTLRLAVTDKVFGRSTYLTLCRESGMPVDPYLDEEGGMPSDTPGPSTPKP